MPAEREDLLGNAAPRNPGRRRTPARRRPPESRRYRDAPGRPASSFSNCAASAASSTFRRAGAASVRRRTRPSCSMRRLITDSSSRQMLAMPAGSRRLERERQHAPRLQRIDDRVHVPARRGVARVQPVFVVGPGLRDARLELRRNRLSRRLQYRSSSGPCTACTAASPSITPIRAVGQAKVKCGSNPWPAIA